MKWFEEHGFKVPQWLHNSTMNRVLTENPLMGDGDRALKCPVEDVLYTSKMVHDIIQEWLSTEYGIQELAYILNERPERFGQIFTESFGSLFHFMEDEEFIGTQPNRKGGENNYHVKSQMVKGKDLF